MIRAIIVLWAQRILHSDRRFVSVFIYAKYAVERLRSEKGKWTLEKIRDFPAGLDDFYEEQFRRICGEGGEKSTAFKFASLIVVAREPLEVDALQAMVGCERRERLQAVARLSVLFPIHDRKMKVNHKSVKDWLTNEERCDEELYIDVKECDKRIAEKCLASLREGNEVVGPYALRQGIAHMLSAGMEAEARETVMRFAWYVERANVKEWNGVLEDLGRLRAALPEDRCVKLLESAARLSAGHVRREPLEVAGQMHARLMGYGDVLSDFLEEILAWRVPDGLKGWWRLVSQTVDPAGGACLQTLEGHSSSVNSVSFSPDGTKVASGSADKTGRSYGM